MIKKILYLLIAVFIVIQFFHPDKNTNNSPEAHANDITKVIPIPDSVLSILQTSCYDCHCNNTDYPWYAEIQPATWWLNHHIEEGKKEINFNEFASYRLRRQYKKLKEIIEQVKEDEMPLSSYTIIHRDAKLSKNQKLVLNNWANAAIDSMQARYPADSLKRK